MLRKFKNRNYYIRFELSLNSICFLITVSYSMPIRLYSLARDLPPLIFEIERRYRPDVILSINGHSRRLLRLIIKVVQLVRYDFI